VLVTPMGNKKRHVYHSSRECLGISKVRTGKHFPDGRRVLSYLYSLIFESEPKSER